MSKLTWIVSVLVCAGCVTTQPLQKDKPATAGNSAGSVGKTISKSDSPAPVSRQETTISRPVTRPNTQPVKASAYVSPVNSNTQKARVAKTDSAPAKVPNVKAQTVEANKSMSVAKHEETPANIIIKGTPKETESQPNNKFFDDKLRQKGIVWAAGGIALAMCGWVVVKRNGKLPKAKTKAKNSKSKNEAADDMEKAWKKGGVF